MGAGGVYEAVSIISYLTLSINLLVGGDRSVIRTSGRLPRRNRGVQALCLERLPRVPRHS